MHAKPSATPLGSVRGRVLWIGLGGVLTILAVVGAVLPVMPTTIFALGAAASFSKGSPRLERWLLEHPWLGPSVLAWRSERAIPLRARCLALVSMAASAAVVAATAPLTVAVGVGVVLVPVALYVGTRPSPSVSRPGLTASS